MKNKGKILILLVLFSACTANVEDHQDDISKVEGSTNNAPCNETNGNLGAYAYSNSVQHSVINGVLDSSRVNEICVWMSAPTDSVWNNLSKVEFVLQVPVDVQIDTIFKREILSANGNCNHDYLVYDLEYSILSVPKNLVTIESFDFNLTQQEFYNYQRFLIRSYTGNGNKKKKEVVVANTSAEPDKK